MPDVRMPDGVVVRFPDDMPPEQIRDLIAKKFPDAAGGGQAAPTAQGSALNTFGQGMTFGFGDELEGVSQGLHNVLFGKGSFGEGYEQGRDRVRGSVDAYREASPGKAMALEVAGAIPTALLPVGNVARGAGFGQKMIAGAKAGAAYGGLYGAGAAEGGPMERGAGAVVGAGMGGLTGLAAEPVAAGVRAAARKVAGPVRGLFNPNAEAARRVALARNADQLMPQPGLVPGDEAIAQRAGQPILNVDRGGEVTRALARSAANTSPEGRVALDAATSSRFEGQGSRVIDTVRRLVGGSSTAQNRELLQASARAANRPAYEAAYSAPGAASVWDEALQQLAGAPVVQSAMRQAAVTGRNKAALGGFSPIKSPFVTDPATGALRMTPNTRPTLQFWDHVKRNLDKMGTGEARQAARVLRDHLDELVPEYKIARRGAAQAFGAEDALDAGEKFVTSRMQNEEAARALTKMSTAERQLFREGFADALVRRVGEAGDRRNVVINGMFASPAARERIVIALGKERARELEAVLRIEGVMDMARHALGNSTSIRQYVELGLAGGTSAYGYATGDWRAAGLAIGGILTRHGVGLIDRNVAKKVGQMLASSDPNVVKNGIRTIARSDAMLDALRNAMAGTGAVAGQRAMAVQ